MSSSVAAAIAADYLQRSDAEDMTLEVRGSRFEALVAAHTCALLNYPETNGTAAIAAGYLQRSDAEGWTLEVRGQTLEVRGSRFEVLVAAHTCAESNPNCVE